MLTVSEDNLALSVGLCGCHGSALLSDSQLSREHEVLLQLPNRNFANLLFVQSVAAADMRAVTQPVAIVRPLRSENSANNEHKKDVEITVIVSESPPPVTYIGDPSDDVGNTSTDVRSSSVSKHLAVESAAEYVVVPGEFIRRRGSILRNPDAPVSSPFETEQNPWLNFRTAAYFIMHAGHC